MNTLDQTNKTKTKMKRGKKIMVIFGIIAAVIGVLMLIGGILQATYFKGKLEQIKPYG